LISYLDFNTCTSGGETVQETITNGREALEGMIEALQAWGRPVPAPDSASCKFVARRAQEPARNAAFAAFRHNRAIRVIAAGGWYDFADVDQVFAGPTMTMEDALDYNEQPYGKRDCIGRHARYQLVRQKPGNT
jgi:predicted RNase H-like HicB family nuclease